VTTSANRPIQIGDVVVLCAPIGGPAMRVTGFGYISDVPQPGPSAKVESLRPSKTDDAAPAWTGEFLLASLRVLPPGHRAMQSPFYDFGGSDA